MRWYVVAIVSSLILMSIPVVAQEGDVTIHVVQRGETLFRIAQQYGLSVNELAKLNSLVNPSNIKVGQRLLISGGDADVTPLPATHRVQPGETLRSIANFYGMSLDDLALLNELANPNTIYVGQVLQIRAEDKPELPIDNIELTIQPTLVSTIEPPATEIPQVANNDIAPEESEMLVHTVQRGETLFRIATRYGLTVNDLARANSINDPTLIYAGQRLVIPGFEPPELALDLPSAISGIDVRPALLVEGKTARFQIRTPEASLISATFLDHELHIASDESQTVHTILQGIPLFTEPGIYPLELVTVAVSSGNITDYALNLEVVGGPYGREYIRLLAGRDALLDPAIEANELALIQNLTSSFNPIRQFDGSMGLPAAATVISPFGTRRSYNGGPFDRFHSGTDFAGAGGTPILATAPGMVVLADTLNVRGLATVIDHGWGVYTGYWHQSQQYVQVGDFVETGQVIGTIGSTGRVTGAHLHWELWVGGVPVDPMQWVQFSFN